MVRIVVKDSFLADLEVFEEVKEKHRCVYWFGTCWYEGFNPYDMLCEMEDEFADVSWNNAIEICFQVEKCPTTGRLHNHYCFKLLNRFITDTFEHLRGAFGGNIKGVNRGKIEEVRKYCSKGYTRVAGPVFMKWEDDRAAMRKYSGRWDELQVVRQQPLVVMAIKEAKLKKVENQIMDKREEKKLKDTEKARLAAIKYCRDNIKALEEKINKEKNRGMRGVYMDSITKNYTEIERLDKIGVKEYMLELEEGEKAAKEDREKQFSKTGKISKIGPSAEYLKVRDPRGPEFEIVEESKEEEEVEEDNGFQTDGECDDYCKLKKDRRMACRHEEREEKPKVKGFVRRSRRSQPESLP